MSCIQSTLSAQSSLRESPVLDTLHILLGMDTRGLAIVTRMCRRFSTMGSRWSRCRTWTLRCGRATAL